MIDAARVADAAAALIEAHRAHARVPASRVAPAGVEEAYAIQDRVALALGGIGGWKVGAKGPEREPTCAPLPAPCIVASPVALPDGAWRARGIETEIALRLAQDLPPRAQGYTRLEAEAAIGEVFVAIEVVESRIEGFPQADPLAMHADLFSHGGLVIGAPAPREAWIGDASRLCATQWFGGEEVARTGGANPAGDLGRLLAWLANHCSMRGHGLRRGQVVTTGSCTGMQFAPPGATVRGAIEGLGEVAVSFRAPPA